MARGLVGCIAQTVHIKAVATRPKVCMAVPVGKESVGAGPQAACGLKPARGRIVVVYGVVLGADKHFPVAPRGNMPHGVGQTAHVARLGQDVAGLGLPPWHDARDARRLVAHQQGAVACGHDAEQHVRQGVGAGGLLHPRRHGAPGGVKAEKAVAVGGNVQGPACRSHPYLHPSLRRVAPSGQQVEARGQPVGAQSEHVARAVGPCLPAGRAARAGHGAGYLEAVGAVLPPGGHVDGQRAARCEQQQLPAPLAAVGEPPDTHGAHAADPQPPGKPQPAVVDADGAVGANEGHAPADGRTPGHVAPGP